MELIVPGLIIFLIGAIAGRIRGSDLKLNDTEKRYGVWGGAVGALVLFLTHNPLWALCAVPLAGLGASLGYHGQFALDVPANRNWKNYAALTATAMFRMFPLFLGAILVGQEWHVLPAVLAGVLFVPIYLLTQKIPFKLPLLTSFTEWGEFFFWGSLYLALAIGLYA